MTTTVDLLAAHPFRADMPDAWLEQMSSYSTVVYWPAGDRLFSEGGRADGFWLIQEGRVALDLYVPGRGDVVVETIGPRAVLGWSWLFPPQLWQFGAVVKEQTEAIELDGRGVLQLCDSQPDLGYDLCRRFMGVLLDRLQATRVRLLDLYGSPLERSS